MDREREIEREGREERCNERRRERVMISAARGGQQCDNIITEYVLVKKQHGEHIMCISTVPQHYHRIFFT